MPGLIRKNGTYILERDTGSVISLRLIGSNWSRYGTGRAIGIFLPGDGSYRRRAAVHASPSGAYAELRNYAANRTLADERRH